MGKILPFQPVKSMVELRKILHAEDDADIREIAKMSLEMIGGFELLQCRNGEEAVRQAEAFGPDLFLMDVMMPDLDGREAMRRLRASGAFDATPVVFVTAKASTTDVEQLKDDFGAMVITKPFDPITLPDELRRIWQQMTA